MNKSSFNNKISYQIFEDNVGIYTHDIAVFTERQSLTYQQLNRKVNQLARYLINDLGVKPGEVVGVCTEHEPERVLALMAIAKAGGVYTPLDPCYPADLLNYMTNKIDVSYVLVSRSDFLLRAYELNSTLINMHEIDYSEYSSENINLPVKSESAMYIIYTSGSTGKPKAVSISHRAAGNLFSWVVDYTNFTSSDTWIQTINPSFDPSMHELMVPLLVGGSIAMIGDTRAIESHSIIDAIIKSRSTHMTTVPSMLTLLTNTPNFSSCASLKHVCVGGEVFRPGLAKRAMDMLPKTQFHNIYGPTEATIMASGWPIKNPMHRDALPIGSAISNMRFYLCTHDRIVETLKPGLEGELCISGVSLANEYVNDPELTQEVFVLNPHDPDPESIYHRLYLTGDRCRVDDNLELYCLGRLDSQVKINGQRVELTEIEYAISALRDVRDVAAFKIGDDLVAAVVPKIKINDEKKWLKSIRDRVGQSLRPIMLPKRLIVIDVVPRQAVSGKADRKILEEQLSKACHRIRPNCRTEVAHNTVEIIRDLIFDMVHSLSTEEFDVEMSFSDLGMDSLNLQMLTLKVNQRCSVEIRVEDLFEYPTVHKLAEFIEEKMAFIN